MSEAAQLEEVDEIGAERIAPTPHGRALVINLQAERLHREWERRFLADDDPDPFAPGGPWG